MHQPGQREASGGVLYYKCIASVLQVMGFVLPMMSFVLQLMN